MNLAFDGTFEFEPDAGIVRVKFHRSADGEIELTGFDRQSRILAPDFQHHFTERDEKLMRQTAVQQAEKVLAELQTGNGD